MQWLLALAVAGSPAVWVQGRATSSETCAACHVDIHRMWRVSAHARALEDPVFQQAHRETRDARGADAARVCLTCHAPLAALDPELEKRVTWDGVGCDVCHSLVAVDVTRAPPKLSFDFGSVKRGPIKDAASTGHRVAYSELHTGALACAGCHEWINAEGTPIMSTFSEWKASRAAAEGRSCQACHMGRTRADVVDPRIYRSPESEVNLHEIPGGHSLSQLHQALTLGIGTPRRAGRDVAFEIRLANRGAGHAVPTGMPGRRVVLEVLAHASTGETFEDRKVYGRFLADAEGRPIVRDSGHFAPGVVLASDSRLAADEQRVETFRFTTAPQATIYLTVKLHYEHSPTGVKGEGTFLTFQSERRVFPPALATPGD